MKRATDNKIILVKRKTRLEELILRYNTLEQAKFYIEHMGRDFNDYLEEDKIYNTALSHSEEIISQYGRIQIIDRAFLPNFCFGKNDIVVVLGQDGLVANTLKYLEGQKLIGVNPDKKRFDGSLLPFLYEDLKYILPEVFNSKRKVSEVTMAKAILKDGQTLYAVNDLFIGQKSHVSSRYVIKYNQKTENQSSSGIIVSTGLGASGWLKSILAENYQITNFFGGKNYVQKSLAIPWNHNKLYFTVREPFPSKITSANIVFGEIQLKNNLTIISNMPENGIIFSDGMEQDFIEFNSGMEAVIEIADKKGQLIV